MSETIQLDEWDNKLIQAFKHACRDHPVTVLQLKEIWADRCALDIQYVHIHDINEHLLALAHHLGLFKNEHDFSEFVKNLNPSMNWKFTCTSREYLKKNTTNFELILLSRLDSMFSLTEVVKLPGYQLETA